MAGEKGKSTTGTDESKVVKIDMAALTASARELCADSRESAIIVRNEANKVVWEKSNFWQKAGHVTVRYVVPISAAATAGVLGHMGYQRYTGEEASSAPELKLVAGGKR